MGYIIKANYQTGDSETDYRTSYELAYVWQSLDICKKALKWLDEQHRYYKELSGYDKKRTIDKINDEVKTKPWYRSINGNQWYLTAILPGDNGEQVIESIPYHGYFEHLYDIEILVEVPTDNDMTFTYR